MSGGVAAAACNAGLWPPVAGAADERPGDSPGPVLVPIKNVAPSGKLTEPEFALCTGTGTVSTEALDPAGEAGAGNASGSVTAGGVGGGGGGGGAGRARAPEAG